MALTPLQEQLVNELAMMATDQIRRAIDDLTNSLRMAMIDDNDIRDAILALIVSPAAALAVDTKLPQADYIEFCQHCFEEATVTAIANRH